MEPYTEHVQALDATEAANMAVKNNEGLHVVSVFEGEHTVIGLDYEAINREEQ